MDFLLKSFAEVVLVCLVSVAADIFIDNINPDLTLTTPQVIRRHGYPSESHFVETLDGYLLTLHRIRHGRDHVASNASGGRRVVFLQHGLLSSSFDWIVNGPGKSLAYILADEGYDVWMGNARGNTYSKAHASLDVDSREFWDFSWHEMAEYDIPSAIDYILSVVNQNQLIYVGHSMGTTIFFAMCSLKPEYSQKVTAMFALAPVAYMGHIKSPIRLLAPWANDVEFIDKFFGSGAFLPSNKIMKILAAECKWSAWGSEICSNVIFLLSGFDRSQFDMTLLPEILSHNPAGTSTKTVFHYAQEINSEMFCQYDYGKSENMKRYKKPNPPSYNLSHVQTPVAMYYADNDWLANVVDVRRLYDELPRKLGLHLINYKGFNHIDFMWGKDARSLVYDDLVRTMKKLPQRV